MAASASKTFNAHIPQQKMQVFYDTYIATKLQYNAARYNKLVLFYLMSAIHEE